MAPGKKGRVLTPRQDTTLLSLSFVKRARMPFGATMPAIHAAFVQAFPRVRVSQRELQNRLMRLVAHGVPTKVTRDMLTKRVQCSEKKERTWLRMRPHLLARPRLVSCMRIQQRYPAAPRARLSGAAGAQGRGRERARAKSDGDHDVILMDDKPVPQSLSPSAPLAAVHVPDIIEISSDEEDDATPDDLHDQSYDPQDDQHDQLYEEDDDTPTIHRAQTPNRLKRRRSESAPASDEVTITASLPPADVITPLTEPLLTHPPSPSSALSPRPTVLPSVPPLDDYLPPPSAMDDVITRLSPGETSGAPPPLASAANPPPQSSADPMLLVTPEKGANLSLEPPLPPSSNPTIAPVWFPTTQQGPPNEILNALLQDLNREVPERPIDTLR